MSQKAPRVDVWANYWPGSFFDAYPPMRDLYARFGLDGRTDLSEQAVLQAARDAKLDAVLLSATAFPGSPVDNDAVVAAIKADPQMLKGCASVDPRTGIAGIRELRHAVNDQGFVALKLLPFLYDQPPDHAIYFPLYAACIELDIPVLVLTGHTAIAKSNHTGRPDALDAVALHFPELRIIAGHAGHPWTSELIALSWKHDNLFIDLSGHRPRHFPPDLLRFMNGFGRSKVLFGTGYPLMDPADPISEFEQLELKPETKGAVLGANALRIVPGLADHGSRRKEAKR